MKLLATLFVSMFFALPVMAEPVRLVVPFSVGGAGDKIGRYLQMKLKESKDISVIVENRPGANTEIGTAAVANTRGKETVLLLAVNTIVTLPRDRGFDITRDLTPVAFLGRQPLMLAAHPSMNVKNLADLKKYDKPINFGTSTKGAPAYTRTEELVNRMNLNAVLVGYKGMADYLPQLLGNHVQLGFFSPALIEPHAAAGKMIPLAVDSKKRLPNFRNVPTFEEQGLKNFGGRLWYMIMVNSTGDKKVVQNVQEALVALLNDKTVIEEFQKIDIYPESDMVLKGKEILLQEIEHHDKTK